MISLLAAATIATNALLSAEYALPTNATPAQFIASAKAMLPSAVTVEGRLTVKNRRGIVQSEHIYLLTRTNGVNTLSVDGQPLAPAPTSSTSQPILDTEVTMDDLTLEYLDWDDIAFAGEGEEEAVHIAISCKVVALRKGGRTMKVWIDRKTGALVQAEECANGKPIRLMWGSRIKKFDGRWAPSQMCVEKPGSGKRTFITVEKIK